MLDIIGRTSPLFDGDYSSHKHQLQEAICERRVLVLGGAGTIGQAVCKEIYKLNPTTLYVVDISENNLVELVRDIRSSETQSSTNLRTFCLDIGSIEFSAFIHANQQFDFIFNLSALKHVRSEQNPFTLMRMLQVNVLNTQLTLEYARTVNCQKYFAVSTDKATAPVNLMGASKLLMEQCIMDFSDGPEVSTARFANVAFSDGSLLHGFHLRMQKQQPIAVPGDIHRYFVTPQEAGKLCLMSAILGHDKDIFYPKQGDELPLTPIQQVAENFIKTQGREPVFCDTEEKARSLIKTLPLDTHWPCLITQSDTSGEKPFEEFFEPNSQRDESRFSDIGVIKFSQEKTSSHIASFIEQLTQLRNTGSWDKSQLINLIKEALPNMKHRDTGKFLDSKM